MLKRVYFYLSALLFYGMASLQVIAQTNYNIEFIDNPTDGGCSSYNDVWGFKHSNGTEYAILGSTCGTVIYSLNSSGNASKVKTIPGATSSWRDIKNYGDYVYVVADAGGTHDGLLVINMSNPSSGGITHSFYEPSIEDAGSATGHLILDRSHNLYIDDDGFIYLAGASGSPAGNAVSQQRINNGGILIFNAATNPTQPPLVGKGPAVYAHDVFVRDNMMVTSEIYAGRFVLFGLTKTPTSVTASVQAAQTTENTFTHNAWTNDDNSIVLTTDEKSGAAIEVFDISDPDQITKLDSYLPFEGANGNEIPHNVHVMGDFAIASHYSEGVKILNIKDPTNVVEVGAYDTHSGTSGFSGCWGAYPFLPSGLLLASDRSHGLFVFNPTYADAGYLAGNVMDESGVGIDGAVVEISALPYNPQTSSLATGDYSLGVVDQATTARGAGNMVSVKVSAPGHETIFADVSLQLGITVTQNFNLFSAALPIQITEFAGVAEGCDHKISWEVRSLAGHSHFDLQASRDGIVFETVKTMLPSDQWPPLSYHVELNNQDSDLQYYRLQQFDLDGKNEFSKIIQLQDDCQTPFSEFSISPNPAHNILQVNSDTNIEQLEIYSARGELLQQIRIATETFQHPLSIDQLTVGLYLLRIKTAKGELVKSFMKS